MWIHTVLNADACRPQKYTQPFSSTALPYSSSSKWMRKLTCSTSACLFLLLFQSGPAQCWVLSTCSTGPVAGNRPAHVKRVHWGLWFGFSTSQTVPDIQQETDEGRLSSVRKKWKKEKMWVRGKKIKEYERKKERKWPTRLESEWASEWVSERASERGKEVGKTDTEAVDERWERDMAHLPLLLLLAAVILQDFLDQPCVEVNFSPSCLPLFFPLTSSSSLSLLSLPHLWAMD